MATESPCSSPKKQGVVPALELELAWDLASVWGTWQQGPSGASRSSLKRKADGCVFCLLDASCFQEARARLLGEKPRRAEGPGGRGHLGHRSSSQANGGGASRAPSATCTAWSGRPAQRSPPAPGLWE